VKLIFNTKFGDCNELDYFEFYVDLSHMFLNSFMNNFLYVNYKYEYGKGVNILSYIWLI
jgi:hypothetical protein